MATNRYKVIYIILNLFCATHIKKEEPNDTYCHTLSNLKWHENMATRVIDNRGKRPVDLYRFYTQYNLPYFKLVIR